MYTCILRSNFSKNDSYWTRSKKDHKPTFATTRKNCYSRSHITVAHNINGVVKDRNGPGAFFFFRYLPVHRCTAVYGACAASQYCKWKTLPTIHWHQPVGCIWHLLASPEYKMMSIVHCMQTGEGL